MSRGHQTFCFMWNAYLYPLLIFLSDFLFLLVSRSYLAHDMSGQAFITASTPLDFRQKVIKASPPLSFGEYVGLL